jgi:hypothetical protein
MSRKLLFVLFFACAAFMVQAQQKMNYQAVVRDASGNPVPSGTQVNLRFTIHDSTATGHVDYTETLSDTANAFSLVTVFIGSTKNLSVVDWSTNEKFLQVEIDPKGGSNFTDMGTSPMPNVIY